MDASSLARAVAPLEKISSEQLKVPLAAFSAVFRVGELQVSLRGNRKPAIPIADIVRIQCLKNLPKLTAGGRGDRSG